MKKLDRVPTGLALFELQFNFLPSSSLVFFFGAKQFPVNIKYIFRIIK